MPHSLAQTFIQRQRESDGRRSISLTADLLEAKRRNESVILSFLEERDLPPWFRGISRYQVKAADDLFNAIRDDSEQHTTHRVSECLSCIGLSPAVNSKGIKLLIRMSQGNDLAFLWFLMEMKYKSPPGTGYNVNEMLILTVIAHLDLITTMRELDRILPPEQDTKIEIARKKRMKEEKESMLKKKKRVKQEYVLPYFEKLTRPKPYGKPLFIGMPCFRPKLGHFKELYSNPNYVVPNETNRWYATYKINTGRRITTQIINQEIDRIFGDFANVALDSKTIGALCEHHKHINELEKRMEDELKVIARERCLKQLNTDGKRQEANRKRIVDELEHDVAKYMCKFRKFTTRARRESMCHLLSKECVCEDDCKCEPKCEIFERLLGGKDSASSDDSSDSTRSEDQIPVKVCRVETYLKKSESDDECNENPFGQESSSNGEEEENVEPLDTLSRAEKAMSKSIKKELENEKAKREQKEMEAKKITKSQNKGMGDCGDGILSETESEELNEQIGDGDDCKETVRLIRIDGDSVVCPETFKKKKVSLSDDDSPHSSMSLFTAKYVHPFDYGHHEMDTPSPSQTFFVAPDEHQPYLFDYRKIFRFKDNTVDSLKIKRAFIEALDCDVALLNRLQEMPPDYDVPVSDCAKKIWKERVAYHNEEMEQKEWLQLNYPKIVKKKSPLNYDQDYFDPDDKELMHKMLKDGLEYLAKSPKFVLASLPEAEKLPVLREWIYYRFGKAYTRAERFKSFRDSVQIFRALDKLASETKNPKIEKLGNTLFVDYSCRDYLHTKANHIKKQYFRKLDANVMEQARIFWFAMVPWLCAKGPPRDTYFAYMPARAMDITRFRLWKPSEYMDAKREWDKKQSEKRKAEFL